MDCDIFTISGWVFGLISTLIALHQFFSVQELKKKIVNMQQVNKAGGTGYQADTMTVNHK